MRGAAAIAFILVEALAYGQGFNRRYDAFGLGRAQGAFDIEPAAGGWMVISVSSDVDSLGVDTFLTHYSALFTQVDQNGVKQSEVRTYRPWHGTTTGWSNCCDTIPGGGYVVGGASEDTLGNDEVYLMRFNAEGDTLWTRVFGDPSLQHFWIGQQVKRTLNGGFVVVGFTDQDGSWDGFVLRTDSVGEEIWRRIYGISDIYADGFAAIIVADHGDLIMSGSTFFADGSGDDWIQRTDSIGDVIWSVLLGGPFSEGSCGISNSSDGHVLVFSGRGFGANYSAMRPYVAKLDSSNGAVIWEKEYDPVLPYTQFHTGKEAGNGTIIAAGTSYEQPGPSLGKGLLALTGAEGDSLWLYRYFYQDSVMQDGTGRFFDVLPTADGGFIAAGAAYYSASGNNPPGISQDTWVVKVDSMGCIVPGCDATGVTEMITNVQDALTVWPNPAKEQAQVGITLPPSLRGQKALTLTVVNATGQAVLSTAAREGNNTVALGALSTGLYHIHLSAGNTWISGTKLMIE